MSFDLEWAEGGIVFHYYGATTSVDFQASMEQFYRDERTDSIKFQIADFSRARLVGLRKLDVAQVAALDHGASQYLKNLRVAIVPPPDDPDSSAYFQQYCDILATLGTGWETSLQDSLEHARAWVAR